MAYYVKFVRGTQDAYNALAHKSSDTLYFITEADEAAGKLYLGETLIAQGSQNEVLAIDQLSDVNISTPLDESHMLVWQFDRDEQGNKLSTGHWVNKTYTEIIGYPTRYESANGNGYTNGLVPPSTEAQASGDYFLAANGTWKQISISGDVSLEKTKVYEISATVNDNHKNKIAEVVGEDVLNTGDIAIVKVTLVPDSNAEDTVDDGKYQYTAYVYKDSNWKPMDGNYSADNVYFEEDFVFTTKIGTVQELTNGSTTVAAKGKSVKEFFAGLFAEEKDPTTSNPTISLTVSGGSGEVGSSYTLPTATLKLTSVGSYTYGPATGVTVEIGNASISQGENNSTSNTSEMVQDSTITLQAKDSETIYLDSSKSYTFNGSITHTDGAIPVTNLGNEYAEGKIESSEINATAATATFSGWRKMFMGTLSDSTTALTSSVIRDLNLISEKVSTSAKTFTVPVGAAKIVIACPDGHTFSKAEYFTMSWEDFDGFVEETQVQVADFRGGENGLKEYNIFTYTPASPFKADTQFRITLKKE